jgi:hypothetical protein
MIEFQSHRSPRSEKKQKMQLALFIAVCLLMFAAILLFS